MPASRNPLKESSGGQKENFAGRRDFSDFPKALPGNHNT
jgi:hypothetical protein